MKLKIRIEEILIGALLGGGFGYVLTAPLLLLAGTSLASLLPLVISGTEPPSMAKLVQLIVSIAGPLGACLGAWFFSCQYAEQHVRGVRYESDITKAETHLQSIETQRFSAAQKSKKVSGLVIGGVELSRSRETAHCLLLGKPDSGKTVLLRGVLQQVLDRGDRVLIHDPKGDFVSTHASRDDMVILGPWDARAALWDASADIDSPALADEFASSLCGVADAGQNRYFHSGAASILAGLLKFYQRDGGEPWTWAQIAGDLGGDPEALIRRAAQGDPRVKQSLPSVFADEGLSVGERSILSTLGNAATLIFQLASVARGRPEADKFSLRDWLTGTAHDETRLVILNSSALYKTASEQIFGTFLGVISAAISAEMPEIDPDEAGTWLVADEAPQLGADGLQHLLTIQEVGRSRGVRCVLAAQDSSQFASRMGHEKAAPMLRMQGVKLILKVDDSAASELCRDVGEREIQRLATTADQGAIQGKTSTYERVPVLIPSDITGLTRTPKGPQMLMQLDDQIGRLIQPYGPRPVRSSPGFEPCTHWRDQKSIESPEPETDDSAPSNEPDNPSPADSPFDGPSF